MLSVLGLSSNNSKITLFIFLFAVGLDSIDFWVVLFSDYNDYVVSVMLILNRKNS